MHDHLGFGIARKKRSQPPLIEKVFSLRQAMAPTIAFLRQRWGDAFEVVVAPFRAAGASSDQAYTSEALAPAGTPLRVLPVIPSGGDVHAHTACWMNVPECSQPRGAPKPTWG